MADFKLYAKEMVEAVKAKKPALKLEAVTLAEEYQQAVNAAGSTVNVNLVEWLKTKQTPDGKPAAGVEELQTFVKDDSKAQAAQAKLKPTTTDSLGSPRTQTTPPPEDDSFFGKVGGFFKDNWKGMGTGLAALLIVPMLIEGGIGMLLGILAAVLIGGFVANKFEPNGVVGQMMNPPAVPGPASSSAVSAPAVAQVKAMNGTDAPKAGEPAMAKIVIDGAEVKLQGTYEIKKVKDQEFKVFVADLADNAPLKDGAKLSFIMGKDNQISTNAVLGADSKTVDAIAVIKESKAAAAAVKPPAPVQPVMATVLGYADAPITGVKIGDEPYAYAQIKETELNKQKYTFTGEFTLTGETGPNANPKHIFKVKKINGKDIEPQFDMVLNDKNQVDLTQYTKQIEGAKFKEPSKENEKSNATALATESAKQDMVKKAGVTDETERAAVVKIIADKYADPEFHKLDAKQAGNAINNAISNANADGKLTVRIAAMNKISKDIEDSHTATVKALTSTAPVVTRLTIPAVPSLPSVPETVTKVEIGSVKAQDGFSEGKVTYTITVDAKIGDTEKRKVLSGKLNGRDLVIDTGAADIPKNNGLVHHLPITPVTIKDFVNDKNQVNGAALKGDEMQTAVARVDKLTSDLQNINSIPTSGASPVAGAPANKISMGSVGRPGKN